MKINLGRVLPARKFFLNKDILEKILFLIYDYKLMKNIHFLCNLLRSVIPVGCALRVNNGSGTTPSCPEALLQEAHY